MTKLLFAHLSLISSLPSYGGLFFNPNEQTRLWSSFLMFNHDNQLQIETPFVLHPYNYDFFFLQNSLNHFLPSP